MSDITQTSKKDAIFMEIYNRSCRLSAAIFLIASLMDDKEILKTKIKNLSLDIVSMSVKLKDILFLQNDIRSITDIEKCSLELMSLLNIASLSGLISKMNADILKEEFQNFNIELGKFSEKSQYDKVGSVRGIFSELSLPLNSSDLNLIQPEISHNLKSANTLNEHKDVIPSGSSNGNGHKRKDLRKTTILNFIKGHNNVSIKDIVPHVVGCSEKTIQREIMELIEEGKIRKVGERRWSKYSII